MEDIKLIISSMIRWGKWRRTADIHDIGYPHHSAEQSIPGANPHEPDYDPEERIDSVVAKMYSPCKEIVFAEYVWNGTTDQKIIRLKKLFHSSIGRTTYHAYLRNAHHYVAGKLEDYLKEVV